jgi:hypothetical protein
MAWQLIGGTVGASYKAGLSDGPGVMGTFARLSPPGTTRPLIGLIVPRHDVAVNALRRTLD